WICSSNGVYRLDPRTNRLERHPLNDHLKGSRVVSRAIRARDGGVWLLGSELYHWRATDGLQQIPLPPEWDVTSVRDVHEDDGRFWVLTDRGLAVRKDSDWELFGTSPEKQLFDFVETQDGSIWLGCNGGIARFDGTRFHFYGYYDGIALNECNTGAALQDSRGVVWLIQCPEPGLPFRCNELLERAGTVLPLPSGWTGQRLVRARESRGGPLYRPVPG
ncbi:MAG: hypothetical protein P8Y94_14540, partial [Acidobacteriota bacterium]